MVERSHLPAPHDKLKNTEGSDENVDNSDENSHKHQTFKINKHGEFKAPKSGFDN